MQRKFIVNLLLLLFLNLLIKPFWVLGIDRTVQNTVGAEEYGTYFALFNFSLILNILLDFGITNFNNRNISMNHNLLNKYLSGIVVLKFLLAIFYLIVIVIIGFVIGYDAERMSILLLLAFNQFLLSFILYLRSNIAGLQMFKTDSFISVLDRLLMIGICSFLLFSPTCKDQFNVKWFVYAQTAAYLATTLITFGIVRSKAKLSRIRFNIPFFRVVLRKSFPYAVLVLLMAFYNRIDTIMLERMLTEGAREAGIYAQAYRLLDSANMIAYLFSVLLLPLFSKMLGTHQSIHELSRLSFKILIAPAVVIACACFFFSKEVMSLLYHEHIEESAQVFRILMVCFIPISTSYVFGTLLTANGNLKELNIIAAMSMFINITLNLVLIPHYFAAGSAVASLVTQLFNAALQLFIASRIFGFRLTGKFIWSLVLFVAGVAVVGYGCSLLPFSWFANLGIMVGVGGVLAFATRLLSVKNFYHIIKYG